jgi:endonuclease/exonuclease/phosphatase family metal-dependent hydrolase
MTFNIQHGIDGSQTYHLQTAIDTIARVNPDVVGVQELTRNHPSYDCDDQPARIADGLQRATGRAWTYVYQQQWLTPDRSCMAGGRGDGPESEGLALFAPVPLAPAGSTPLWNSGLGLAVRPTGVPLPVVVTHLAAGASGAADRAQQIGALLPWTAGLGSARVLVGDFNASPGAPEMQPVFAAYRDAWAEALRAGSASGQLDGLTHRQARIDYVLYAPSSGLTLVSAETVDTVPLVGRDASDHRPVVATFRVR